MDQFSLTSGYSPAQNGWQRAGLILGLLVTVFFVSTLGVSTGWPASWQLILVAGGYAIAGGLYTYGAYAFDGPGIHNDANTMMTLTSRGLWGWIVGVGLTLFYIVLYFYPTSLGLGVDGAQNTGMVALFDPLSLMLNGKPASQWFMYGTLYTVAILTLGIKFMMKYRHNRYQQIRTFSVMLCQLGLAFLIPEILASLNAEDGYYVKDLKNIWPLNYYFFETWHLDNMRNAGNMGMFFLIWGILLFTVISPVLTYFYGKRWYCSWVCGCGGLAETAGDSFRQLSDKSLFAWKIERWMIHSVLVFAVVMTALVLYRYFTKSSEFLFINTYDVSKVYGFLIGSIFSGVIGTGFYPILGSRVWCRFGCPMAAILGLQQKFFSRFRITTNGSQCISCGNCSAYCEMGIDVRWYAQRGQDIVRASCVGCGICSAVCPRGVLRLEGGGDIHHKAEEIRALHISSDGVQLVD